MAGQNLEDEMSRFEREIASAGQGSTTGPSTPGSSFVIGSSTFNAVQQQLSSLRAQVYGNNPPAAAPSQPNPTSQYNNSSNNARTTVPALSRPPAPPALNGSLNSSPAMPFMPPQIRLRTPGPHGQLPGPPSFMGPPMQHQRPRLPPPSVSTTLSSPSLSGAPIKYTDNKQAGQPIQQSKVVYAAQPVLNKPQTTPNQSSQATKDVHPVDNRRKRELDEKAQIQSQGESSNAGLEEGSQQSAPPAKKEKKKKEKKFIRTAANDVWEDQSLAEWDPSDFRVFCGDLGNEVTDEKLAEAFKKYPSLQKTKVIRDRRTHKTKGFGFISFKDPVDYTRAMREMNGKYVGNRPIKLRKSNWKDRNVEVVKKKEKEKKRLGFR